MPIAIQSKERAKKDQRASIERSKLFFNNKHRISDSK